MPASPGVFSAVASAALLAPGVASKVRATDWALWPSRSWVAPSAGNVSLSYTAPHAHAKGASDRSKAPCCGVRPVSPSGRPPSHCRRSSSQTRSHSSRPTYSRMPRPPRSPGRCPPSVEAELAPCVVVQLELPCHCLPFCWTNTTWQAERRAMHGEPRDVRAIPSAQTPTSSRGRASAAGCASLHSGSASPAGPVTVPVPARQGTPAAPSTGRNR